MLAEHDQIPSRRSILLAGVMNGYAFNYAVPRLGEITRCYYVSKHENKPVAAIMGTVVLERIIDLVVLMMLMVVVMIYVVTDKSLILNLLGLNEADNARNFYLRLAIMGTIGFGSMVAAWWIAATLAPRFPWLSKARAKAALFGTHFKEGLLSTRTIRHPFRFLLLTAGLWICYVAMAGIPFTMLPGSGLEHLGILEALVITVVSSLGVVIPSPGGLGTYHLFVQKSLFLLYGIPETVGFTYALVSHGMVFIVVMVMTPATLLFAGRGLRKPRIGN